MQFHMIQGNATKNKTKRNLLQLNGLKLLLMTVYQ